MRNDTDIDIYFEVSTLLQVPVPGGIRRISKMWLDGLANLNPILSKIRVHPIAFHSTIPTYSFELFRGDIEGGFGFPLHATAASLGVDSKLFIPAYDFFIPNENIDVSRIAEKTEITSVIDDLLPITNPEWFPWRGIAESNNFRKVIQRQIFYSSKIIVNSTQVKKDLMSFASSSRLKLHESNIRVIPLASYNCDHTHSKASPSFAEKNGSSQFLMVGTIEPQKGHDEVLKAFMKARNLNADVTLTIVGGIGWGVEDVLKKIKRCQNRFPLNFTWLANVTDTELSEQYRDADAVIIASKGEGFGMSVVESLGMAKATFVRGIPVLEEVSKGHAVTFGADKDYKSLLSIFLASDQAIKRATEKAKGFTPNLLSENLRDILDFLRV